MKKAAQIFSRILSVLLIIVILFAGYVFVSTIRAGKNKVPNVFGYSFLRVATGSMEPTIPTGSLIIVHKANASDIRVGDVICFYSADPQIEGMPNTHRVADVRNEDGKLSFITQGDASDTPDQYPVSADRLVGVYVRSFQMGKALDVMHSRYFFFFVLLIPMCVVIFLEFLHVKKVATKKESDDAQDV